MPRTMLIERGLVPIFVVGVGIIELLHAIFDGLQFMANAEFVGTVLSMEATREPDSWRAIHSPAVAVFAYGLIWLAHAAAGILCFIGSYLLIRNLAGEKAVFDRVANVATLGVGIGCTLYLVGFLGIASNWFLLYTAPTPPNYIPNATLLFLVYVSVLIYMGSVRRA